IPQPKNSIKINPKSHPRDHFLVSKRRFGYVATCNIILSSYVEALYYITESDERKILHEKILSLWKTLYRGSPLAIETFTVLSASVTTTTRNERFSRDQPVYVPTSILNLVPDHWLRLMQERTIEFYSSVSNNANKELAKELKLFESNAPSVPLVSYGINNYTVTLLLKYACVLEDPMKFADQIWSSVVRAGFPLDASNWASYITALLTAREFERVLMILKGRSRAVVLMYQKFVVTGKSFRHILVSARKVKELDVRKDIIIDLVAASKKNGLATIAWGLLSEEERLW
ncbi:hypothetical protein HK096_002147, partial [Nowakowskiella sp. JEL0078]